PPPHRLDPTRSAHRNPIPIRPRDRLAKPPAHTDRPARRRSPKPNGGVRAMHGRAVQLNEGPLSPARREVRTEHVSQAAPPALQLPTRASTTGSNSTACADRTGSSSNYPSPAHERERDGDLRNQGTASGRPT